MSDDTGRTIETMFQEDRRYPPSAEFAAQANAQPDIYERDFEEFWDTEARERLTWFEPYSELYEWSPPFAKWYLGGRLNVCFNCVDRHVEAGRGDKVAFHWEGEPADERETLTYAELQRQVSRFANALKELGVRKGTPVAIYMGMVPSSRSRCSRARASARRTPSSSAASPQTRSRAGSTTCAARS